MSEQAAASVPENIMRLILGTGQPESGIEAEPGAEAEAEIEL